MRRLHTISLMVHSTRREYLQNNNNSTTTTTPGEVKDAALNQSRATSRVNEWEEYICSGDFKNQFLLSHTFDFYESKGGINTWGVWVD